MRQLERLELTLRRELGTVPGAESEALRAELGAATAEVARLQPDGTWLYVIDNAWGDQAAP